MATLEKLRVLLLTWFHLRSPSSSVNFLRKFSYKDIKKATDGFRRVVDNSSNVVSYRAKFRNGHDAIVKEIRILNDPDDDAFLSAVQLLGRLHHRHIAALCGFSIGRKRFLVFEYIEGGSLKDHLSDPLKTPLSWRTRLQITVGIAAALAIDLFWSCATIRELLEQRMCLEGTSGEYLLFFCNPPIYHVSISSSTIMLDENLVPKLSESSLFGATRSHRASHELPKKESSDQSSSSIIFQLGLVILELITGQSSETGLADLIHWVRESHVPRSTNRMIDPDLGNDYNSTELKGLLAVARLCIDSVDEPSRNTSQILRYLKTQIAPTRASVRSC